MLARRIAHGSSRHVRVHELAEGSHGIIVLQVLGGGKVGCLLIVELGVVEFADAR